MKFKKTKFKDLYLISLDPFTDDRGRFTRLFCKKEFKNIGLKKEIVQINHSFTRKKGTVRGMHFQKSPKAESKIITCIKGMVFDVAVDMRKDSRTFLQWHSIELSPKNLNMVYIPDGFAHGFQTLKANSELIYLHTGFYEPKHEDGLNPQDPLLKIHWPLDITEMSKKDNAYSFIKKHIIS